MFSFPLKSSTLWEESNQLVRLLTPQKKYVQRKTSDYTGFIVFAEPLKKDHKNRLGIKELILLNCGAGEDS